MFDGEKLFKFHVHWKDLYSLINFKQNICAAVSRKKVCFGEKKDAFSICQAPKVLEMCLGGENGLS